MERGTSLFLFNLLYFLEDPPSVSPIIKLSDMEGVMGSLIL
jgi:hypothetical protein